MIPYKSLPKLKKTLLKFLPEIVLFIIYCTIQLTRINIDFWNDEIYTLRHFTFTSFYSILTDYHEPNNHIFFNLLNHIYLKLIHLDSLSLLMDAPYKLRIIPLIYSFFTLYFTYRTAMVFFNKTIGLLAAIILITTIPYFTFVLQIRGYGLSMLLLVIIVYYCFSYLNTPKNLHLFLISLSSTLIIYTIPSNIYPIFSIILIYSVYTSISIIKNSYKERQLKVKFILSEYHFRIVMAIILGSLISLVLYFPIFKAVFTNSYVKSGTSYFVFSKLKFLFPEIIQGIVSARWLLIVLVVSGLLFNIKEYKKWWSSLVLLIAICMLPLIFVYIRGDDAPSRIFVVSSPFSSLVLAVGIYTFWKVLVKKIYLSDHYLVMLVLVYSLFIFNKEVTKIDTTILSDIKNGGRSQSLYHQYYSFHYQPLKDITEFKKQYIKKRMPVLIYGCEPHDIPNYLLKFDIPFYKEDALDSLLLRHDSIYIVTNHPYSLKTIQEYEATMINQKLTYHTFLLFHKIHQLTGDKIQLQLNSLSEKYKDSINFVFNMYNVNSMKEFMKTNSCYHISYLNQNDLGKLITFATGKPYLCYLSTKETNSENINYIIKDTYKTMENYNYKDIDEFYLGKNVGITTTGVELYFNNYEEEKWRKKDNKLIDSTCRYAGLYSEKLDSSNTFSTTFSFPINKTYHNMILKVSFMGNFIKDSKGIVVLDVGRDGKQYAWNGNGINIFFNPQNQWQKVITTFHVKDNLIKNDVIKIYVWNPEKENIWIDDLKIEFIEPSPKKSTLQ